MKETYYKFGDYKCHAYCKQAGHGWEVGFWVGQNCVFVGNFIHQKEATKWWGTLNKEVKSFTKHYGFGEGASFAWYKKFFSTHLYKTYYTFLDSEFAKYHRTFDKAWKQDAKKYSTLKKKWHGANVYSLKKAS